MSHVLVSSAARTAAALTLLALAFGLPQFLVICTPKAGAPRVELTCSAGCQHPHGRPTAADDEDRDQSGAPNATDDCGGCTHLALGVELGPPPVKLVFSGEPEIAADETVASPGPRLPTQGQRAWTQATGPPRPGRTITILRTTELLE